MGALNTLNLLIRSRRNQWLKRSELDDLQTKKLRAIIKHAYNTTEFYHRKFKHAGIDPGDIRSLKDLHKIPFTTKSELRDTYLNKMLSKGTDLSKCRIIPTSGSTGTPLKMVYDQNADDFSKANNLRSMIENGLGIRDRWVNIGDTRTVRKPTWFQKLGILNLQTLNLFDDIDKQIDELKNINPDTIIGYPSQLKLLAQYISKHAITGISPRNVFTTAELLDEGTRKLINSGFNVNVVDLFGCIELNRTAWECSEHQGYHIDVDAIVMEFLNGNEAVSPGERGRIVYTSLFNYAMPLIRYDIGDIAIPCEELCDCGRGLPLMKSIEGRTDDFILLPNGKSISPIVFALILKHSDGVKEYQILQTDKKHISVTLNVSEKFDKSKEEHIRREIITILNNEISIDIKYVSKIQAGTTGKIRSVISKV